MDSTGTIELVVSLRVPDVVAATALRALKDRLNFTETLHGLKRRDYYRFRTTGDRSAAESLARDLIRKTTTFVNPNKHSYSIRLDGRSLIDDQPRPTLPDGVRAVSVLVLPLEEDDDREGTVDFLRRKLGAPGLMSVSSGVLWELYLKAGDDEAAREIARDITVARRRTEGLLLNPHYQRFELL